MSTEVFDNGLVLTVDFNRQLEQFVVYNEKFDNITAIHSDKQLAIERWFELYGELKEENPTGVL